MEEKYVGIVVCKPGFTENGGSGYLDGSISKLRESKYNIISVTDIFVYWSDDFLHECGVYHRALRKATPLEIKAYNSGIRNIGNIEKSTYVISYETTDNKTKKNTIKATSKEDAISKLKNLKNVNYIIG